MEHGMWRYILRSGDIMPQRSEPMEPRIEVARENRFRGRSSLFRITGDLR